jgi:pantoate--beta-alanine ligase
MLVVRKKQDLQNIIQKQKQLGKKIGFVPTMGYLHEGHLSLMSACKKDSDFLVVSIFVNPLQFNDPKDFEKYPKDEQRDLQLCESIGVDLVYLPELDEIYPEGPLTTVTIKIPHLMNCLCGKSRPGHFEGVLIVLARLFHILQPDIAYFGKKDYQQFLIVREFVKELMFPIEIRGLDTVREKNGLAMSSRNSRLNPKELEAATLLFRSLKIAEEYAQKKNISIEELIEVIRDVLLSSSLIKIDYISILNPETLQPKESLKGKNFIGIAAFVGEVRLIDNHIFEVR